MARDELHPKGAPQSCCPVVGALTGLLLLLVVGSGFAFLVPTATTSEDFPPTDALLADGHSLWDVPSQPQPPRAAVVGSSADDGAILLNNWVYTQAEPTTHSRD
jgi:hypothetical protein